MFNVLLEMAQRTSKAQIETLMRPDEGPTFDATSYSAL